MAKAKTSGSGWNKESLRHSNARRFGRAGGSYASMTYSQLKAKGVNLKPNADSDGDGVKNSKDCKPLNKYAQDNSKIFNLGDGYTVSAEYEKTRNGFRHVAVLYKDGQEIDRDKATYQNRTWESYEYQSVVDKIINKNFANENERKRMKALAEGKSSADLEQQYKTVGAIAKMGELFGETKKEKNDWKKRMLKAGISGLDIPDDWDKLSENEKEKRLNKVIEFSQNMKPKKEEKKSKKKSDLVDKLMKYESGEMNEEESKDFLKELDKNGLGNKLQGHYGRAIAESKRQESIEKEQAEYFKNKSSSKQTRTETTTQELPSRYSREKSFYGKAKVTNYSNGDKVLRSYQTDVAEIKNGKLIVNGTYSQTTTRHIKEFAKQNGFPITDTKQMIADYSKKE